MPRVNLGPKGSLTDSKHEYVTTEASVLVGVSAIFFIF